MITERLRARLELIRAQALSVADMDALPVYSQVIDAQADISTKRADGLWDGYEMAAITSAKLHKYGPIRLFNGKVLP